MPTLLILARQQTRGIAGALVAPASTCDGTLGVGHAPTSSPGIGRRVVSPSVPMPEVLRRFRARRLVGEWIAPIAEVQGHLRQTVPPAPEPPRPVHVRGRLVGAVPTAIALCQVDNVITQARREDLELLDLLQV